MNGFVVVGFCGKAGAGKSTSAARLVRAHRFAEIALADPLKRAVADIFAIPPGVMEDRARREEPLPHWPGWTPRKLLQFVGTECLREKIAADVWVRSCVLHVRRLGPGRYTVPDVRFPNEAEGLRSAFGDGFRLVKIVRPGCDGSVGIPGHASEAHDLDGCDATIANDGTVEDMLRAVDDIAARCGGCA